MPWWYRAMQRGVRRAYPGVPPWEWDAHPEWLARVIVGINAECDAETIKRNT